MKFSSVSKTQGRLTKQDTQSDSGGTGADVLGRFVAVNPQGNKIQPEQQRTSLQSVSNSETDVTVNLSTFAELLMTNNDGTKDQQKLVDGPQL